MIRSSRLHLLLPLLVLGMVFAVSASVHSQASAATNATLQINFGTAPQWGYVPGTRVREIRQGQHPDYDVFRYGSRYYAYDNNRWYSSNRSSGTYRQVDERNVPSQFSRVPARNWKHYPSGWQNGNRGQGHGNDGRGPQSGGYDTHR